MILSEVPGYSRALERGKRLQQREREFGFLGATDRICGVEVRLLTFRMFNELLHARSPFIRGGLPTVADVGVFLWRLSPAYDAAFAARRSAREAAATYHQLNRRTLRYIALQNGIAVPRFARRLTLVRILESQREAIAQNAFRRVKADFADSIICIPFVDALRAIYRFMDRMLRDQTGGRRRLAKGDDEMFADISYAADVVHTVAIAYGWGKNEVLDCAMPEVFQLVRQINRTTLARLGKNMPPIHPLQARLTKRFRKKAEAAALAAALAAQ
jgi:hypothetical protein